MPARTLVSTLFAAILAAAFIGALWHMTPRAADLSGLPTTAPEISDVFSTSTATSSASGSAVPATTSATSSR